MPRRKSKSVWLAWKRNIFTGAGEPGRVLAVNPWSEAICLAQSSGDAFAYVRVFFARISRWERSSPRSTSTLGPERSSSVRQAVTSPSKTFFSLPGAPSSIFTSLHSVKVGLPCHFRSGSETTTSKALALDRVWNTRMPRTAAASSPWSLLPSRCTANSVFNRDSGTGSAPSSAQSAER